MLNVITGAGRATLEGAALEGAALEGLAMEGPALEERRGKIGVSLWLETTQKHMEMETYLDDPWTKTFVSSSKNWSSVSSPKAGVSSPNREGQSDGGTSSI